MALTHTNAVRYRYTAGGGLNEKEVTRTVTGGAETNVSETLTVTLGTTTAQDITGFDFVDASSAISVYMMVDGYASGVSLYANGTGGTLMATLEDGVPYVWTSGTTNFPPGQTNPMVNSTAKITALPSGAGSAAEQTVNVNVKVLYDPIPLS